jgi:hypothetical protein
MPSHYDHSKNCRAGTMDEAQFYDEAGAGSAAYFKSLLAKWGKAGGTLKWGAGGVGLRGEVKSKEVGFCFVAPAFGSKTDRIELGCSQLKKQIGEARCSTLVNSLRDAAGDQCKGQSMISITSPGSLPAAKLKALTKALTDLL